MATTKKKNDDIVDPAAMELIATLVAASADSLNWTTNQLLDGYREQAISAQVELDLIRSKIEDLFYGPYQPSQAAILGALWPNKKVVEEITKQRMEPM